MTRPRWLLAVLSAVLALVAGLVAWGLLRSTATPVATATRGTVAAQVSGPGTVQARVPLTVSARITSTIGAIAVDVGDTVQPGQLLVTLEGRDLAAREAGVLRQQESLARQEDAAAAAVARARADLDLALARERRDADLQAQGFVSRASFDASAAGARSAQAALLNAQALWAARRADRAALAQELVVARAQLGYARLVAPMPGLVVQRLAEPGATVGPGTPILRLVDPHTLWVATRVDEALVDRVAVGQPATIRLRSGRTVTGRVQRISPQSDVATRELDVHVAFTSPPAQVAIDQEAEVRIETGRERGLVLPVGAIGRDASGRPGVLQVVDGRARFRPVDLGEEADGVVLVRRGLAEGDRVVARASAASDGKRVHALAGAQGSGGHAWNSR
ncbi:MAG: efflux RND transporter periplasmic adaptor subunit [Ramlibacter sp.]